MNHDDKKVLRSAGADALIIVSSFALINFDVFRVDAVAYAIALLAYIEARH